jgi:tetratricopeptide (TPR) repeat protein
METPPRCGYPPIIMSWFARNLCRFVVPAIAIGAVGCAAHAYRGSALYQEGRYIEAAETFERTAYRLPTAVAQDQAEYGLYRGLNFLRLGDLSGAREWLSYATQIERDRPGTLDAQEKSVLTQGWAELEARLRQEPGPRPDSEIASASADGQVGTTFANGQRSLSPTTQSLVPR